MAKKRNYKKPQGGGKSPLNVMWLLNPISGWRSGLKIILWATILSGIGAASGLMNQVREKTGISKLTDKIG